MLDELRRRSGALARMIARTVRGGGETHAPRALGPHASLAYRSNREAIVQGTIPEKYLRILPMVPGQRVLEVGAAEGVLALLLAREKEKVYALDQSAPRHEEAIRLREAWRERGEPVDNCEMILGDLRDRFDLLDQVDTFVAVRMVYYLEEDLRPTFREIGRRVPNVVLCGNADRARYYAKNRGKGLPRTGFGPYDHYASLEGMVELLEESGYRIAATREDGDAIVVGAKDPAQAG